MPASSAGSAARPGDDPAYEWRIVTLLTLGFGPVGLDRMGWLKDLTGSFDSGLALMAVIVMISAGFAALLGVYDS